MALKVKAVSRTHDGRSFLVVTAPLRWKADANRPNVEPKTLLKVEQPAAAAAKPENQQAA